MNVVLTADPETGMSLEMRARLHPYERKHPNQVRVRDVPSALIARYAAARSEWLEVQAILGQHFDSDSHSADGGRG